MEHGKLILVFRVPKVRVLGIGIGLTLVYNIVLSYYGTINVSNTDVDSNFSKSIYYTVITNTKKIKTKMNYSQNYKDLNLVDKSAFKWENNHTKKVYIQTKMVK